MHLPKGRWHVDGFQDIMEAVDFGTDHRPSDYLQLQTLGKTCR